MLPGIIPKVEFRGGTVFGSAKINCSMKPKLEIGLSACGFTIYGDIEIGPYVEIGIAGIATGNFKTWNAAKFNAYLEYGANFKAGVGVKYQFNFSVLFVGNVKITLLDLHYNIADIDINPTVYGNKVVALSYVKQDESFTIDINCQEVKSLDLSIIDNQLTFQDFENMKLLQKPVDSVYSISENSGKSSWAKIKDNQLLLSDGITNDFTIQVSHCEIEEVPYKASTCTTMGQNAYTYCVECNGIVSGSADKIDMLPHNDSLAVINEDTLRSVATCEASATYWYSCVDCGIIVKESFFEYGEPLEHIWDDKYSSDQERKERCRRT